MKNNQSKYVNWLVYNLWTSFCLFFSCPVLPAEEYKACTNRLILSIIAIKTLNFVCLMTKRLMNSLLLVLRRYLHIFVTHNEFFEWVQPGRIHVNICFTNPCHCYFLGKNMNLVAVKKPISIFSLCDCLVKRPTLLVR